MTTTAAKDRVKELKSALQVKATELDGLASAWKDETGRGDFVISTEQRDLYVKTLNEAEEIKQLLGAQEKAAGIFEFLEQPERGVVAASDTVGAARLQDAESKSLGEMWLKSEAYAEMKASGWNRFGLPFSLDRSIADFGVKDVYSAMGGTITVPTLGTPQNLGLTPRTLRPGRVRDLFPAETTSANILYGIRETGFTNRAGIVPERRAADGISPPTGGPTDVFALKPRSDLTIVPVTYPLATIAHVMHVHRQTLADEPRMRGLIDRDLIDGVKMVEDSQLLFGDGVGDNLTGICNTSGIQLYTGEAADPRTAQIRRAITRVTLAYFQPTGIIMHPLDFEDLELERESGTGAYRLALNVAVGAEKRVWRLNVVDTPAMIQGKALIGAFGTGSKIYDREAVNIAVSTENRDLFERNAVTLRAESRLGLVVDRPESHCLLSFTDTP